MEENALRLRAVIEAAIDGIITINQRGQIETINQAARTIFGYTSEELIGKNVHVLMPSPYHEEHDGYLERYHETRIPHIIGIGREVRGRKKNGEVFPLRLAVSQVDLPDRIIYTGVIHDLTEVKRAERALEELNLQLETRIRERTEELDQTIAQLQRESRERKRLNDGLVAALEREKELNELKSRFVSTTSHEFRTPLSTILSSADLIAAYERTDQQHRREKHVDRIRRAVRGLTDILNDLLTLSRLDEGRVETERTTVSVPDLVQKTYDDLEPTLKPEQDIMLQHQGAEEVQSDAKMLRHILENLLSNAIKYSEKDIECRTKITDTQLLLTVRDRGIGIPAADQRHLFSRFFRASNVNTISGTGLGLNIVQQYAEELGGSIRCESVEGKGTTFYLQLPLEDPYD